MRSLTVKLSIAFLLIGVVSVLIFGVLMGIQTGPAFSQFIVARERQYFVDGLTALAEGRAAGDTVDFFMQRGAGNGPMVEGAIIADANGVVVRGAGGFRPGTRLPEPILAGAEQIEANGEVIGYVTFTPAMQARRHGEMMADEQDFRQGVYTAALGAGLFAILAGVVASGFLARTFSRPILELTKATRAMAAGELNQQVPVRTNDELGVLAHSFNQMSADLAHSTFTRRQMTADLAHDLRTPLAVLRGYSEGLLEGRVEGSPQLYATMYDEVTHIQRLVEDLRVLSLADAGELPLNLRPVDPAALLERAGLAHMQTAIDRGIELKVDAAEGLPDLQVDTDRMAQVLNNLVANALRFTREGSVTLSARTSPSDHPDADVHAASVVLEVADTGTGIAAEDLPFVFERFYRADPSRTRADNDASGAGESSGLGLAIARAIVEAHGGAIRVSSAPGAGSTFTVTLPVAPAPSGA